MVLNNETQEVNHTSDIEVDEVAHSDKESNTTDSKEETGTEEDKTNDDKEETSSEDSDAIKVDEAP